MKNMRAFVGYAQKNNYISPNNNTVNLMKKDHSILKKWLAICLVVLSIGTTAHLLLNLSGDNVDNIDQVNKVDNITSGKPANEPADHNVASYWWWAKTLAELAALQGIAIYAMYRSISKDNPRKDGNWLMLCEVLVGVIAFILGGGLFGHRLSQLYPKLEEACKAWFNSALKGD